MKEVKITSHVSLMVYNIEKEDIFIVAYPNNRENRQVINLNSKQAEELALALLKNTGV